MSTSSQEQLLTLRQAPNYLAFSITGGVLGVILAAILTFIDWPAGFFSGGETVDDFAQQASSMSVFGVLAVVFAAIGVGLALVIAMILDRRSAKRAETIRAIPADEPSHPSQDLQSK